jgi:hypothetical protein
MCEKRCIAHFMWKQNSCTFLQECLPHKLYVYQVFYVNYIYKLLNYNIFYKAIFLNEKHGKMIIVYLMSSLRCYFIM